MKVEKANDNCRCTLCGGTERVLYIELSQKPLMNIFLCEGHSRKLLTELSQSFCEE